MMKTFSIVKTPLFTLILAIMLIGTIGIAAAVSKNNGNQGTKSFVTTTWYYQGGNSNAEILDANNWTPQSEGGEPHENCDPEAADLPCAIPGSEDPNDFQTELNSLGVSGVMIASPQKRPFETP